MTEPKKSIDSLMMTFADLTGPSKASSFKGPALKDVKVNKGQAPSFTTSNKARDWSSFAQNLEDAFRSSSNDKNIGFNTNPQFDTSILASNSLQTESLSSSKPGVDDWGDFQSHPVASTVTKPPVITKPSVITNPQSHLQPAQAVQILEEEDDFSDFISANSNTKPSQQQPQLHESQQPQSHHLHQLQQRREQSELVQPNFNPNTFQTPFVVDFASNFGDIVKPSKVPEPFSSSLKPEIALDDKKTDMITPQPPTIDRYSNLRNVFEILDDTNDQPTSLPSNLREATLEPISTVRDQDDFGDFITPKQNPQTLPSTGPTSLPTTNLTSLLDLEISSPDPTASFGLSNLAVSDNSKVELDPISQPKKIHDLKLVSQGDELSSMVFNESASSSETKIMNLPSVFMPQKTKNFAPWLSDSPPPLPSDEDEPPAEDDRVSRVGEFGFSELNTFSNIDMPVIVSPIKAKSVSEEAEKTASEELRGSSPVVGDIQRKGSNHSLHLSEDDRSSPNPKDIVTRKQVVDIQLQVLQSIEKVLSECIRSFKDSTDQVLEEMVRDPKGCLYIRNLEDLYCIFARIKISSATQNYRQFDEIEQHWREVRTLLKISSPTTDLDHSSDQRTDLTCLLCLAFLSQNDVEQVQNNGNFHIKCANFWLNRISKELPYYQLSN